MQQFISMIAVPKPHEDTQEQWDLVNSQRNSYVFHRLKNIADIELTGLYRSVLRAGNVSRKDRHEIEGYFSLVVSNEKPRKRDKLYPRAYPAFKEIRNSPEVRTLINSCYPFL